MVRIQEVSGSNPLISTVEKDALTESFILGVRMTTEICTDTLQRG